MNRADHTDDIEELLTAFFAAELRPLPPAPPRVTVVAEELPSPPARRWWPSLVLPGVALAASLAAVVWLALPRPAPPEPPAVAAKPAEPAPPRYVVDPEIARTVEPVDRQWYVAGGRLYEQRTEIVWKTLTVEQAGSLLEVSVPEVSVIVAPADPERLALAASEAESGI